MRHGLIAIAAFVAACFLLCLPAAVRAEDDAQALLAKHKAYVGWQLGDGTFKTLRISAQVSGTKDGSPAIVGHWTQISMGPIFRTVGSIGDYGFTGSVFWESDENGFTRPDYSPYQGFEIAHTVLFGEATALLAGTLQPTKVIDGTSYPVVRVAPPHGDIIDLYVDPATGAYRRAVIDPDGSFETTYDVLAYTDVLPGKRMISKYRIDGGSETTELTKIEPNVEIASQSFHPPAQVATWTFANPNPFRISVKPNAIFLDATINGVQGRFILDTGADGIALDSSFANRAHLKTVRSGTAGGVGPDVIKTLVQTADTVTIGGNTLSNVSVYSGKFDFHVDEENADGLIGFPLFGGAIVAVNTGAQTMTISDPQTTAIDRSAGYPVLVDLSDETPVVPMLIDNRVKVNALLDMGNGGFIAMSQNLVSKRHVPMMASDNYAANADDELSKEAYLQSHVEVTGIGGTEEERCSTLASIALGPITVQSTQACVSPSLTGNDFVIMGYDFLKEFDFVFDYREGLIMMKPHQQ